MTEQWNGVPENPEQDDLWAQGFGRATRMNLGSTLRDYWHAPGSGPLHAEWGNKPHRLLYDLIGEILHLRAEVAAREAASAEAMREACAAEHDEAAKRQAEPGPSIEFTSGFASAYERAWASALRTLPIPHASALARAEKAAYQRGWNDRESDFLTGVERTGMAVVGPDALAAAEKRGMERAADMARHWPTGITTNGAIALSEAIRNAVKESEG